MVPLSTVRASNTKLKDLGPGLVAVFVGGTSGVGESTLKAFVKNTVQPRVYIIGRNESAAQKTIKEVSSSLNPDATCTFLSCDTSLLANVDSICNEIASKEKHINLLFLTCGGPISFSGRSETTEGLDRKLALSYYARFRFASNLVPLLSAAGRASPARLARVTSVLSAGLERPINESDLSLEKSYSLAQAHAHATVMSDFACEQLARLHSEVAFVHMYPGFVKTNQINPPSFLLRVVMNVVAVLATPFAVDLVESGERSLFNATAEVFGPRGEGEGEGEGGKEAREVGSDGVRGSGAYILKWDGSVLGKQEVLGPMRERGAGEKIWEHTLEVFGRVRGTA